MKVRNLVEAKHAIAAASSPFLKPRLYGHITRELLAIETQEAQRLAEVHSEACADWISTASVDDAQDFLSFSRRMAALQEYLSIYITSRFLEAECFSDWSVGLPVA